MQRLTEGDTCECDKPKSKYLLSKDHKQNEVTLCDRCINILRVGTEVNIQEVS